MVTFRLTCLVVLWGGRNTVNKYHWHLWGVLAVSRPHWVCPRSRRVGFPVYTSQALGCSAGELSEMGPGMCALPRSKLLRFWFSGSPQMRRLGWACVLCPSQVRAAQATRCLVSTVSPVVWCLLLPPQFQPLGFLGAQWERHLRCAMYHLWRADL